MQIVKVVKIDGKMKAFTPSGTLIKVWPLNGFDAEKAQRDLRTKHFCVATNIIDGKLAF